MKMNRLLITLIIIALSYQSCDILNQMVTFTKCDFKMNTLTNANLAGIDVQTKKSFSDLTLMDAANVSKSLLQGTLPLTFTLNIEAHNPNTSAASMQKLEWRAFIDDIEIAAGVADQKISIPPAGSQVIPLLVQVDIKKLLNNEAKNTLLNFGFNLAGAGNYPTRVKLDIKPTVYVGTFPLSYPGYFTLKKEFGAN